MTNRQYKKKIKRMVFGNLDMIVSTVTKIATVHKVERVPLKLIYSTIDKAKPAKIGDPASDEFISSFIDTLTSIKSVVKASSEMIGDGCITVDQLSLIIEEVKKGFQKAIDKNM